MDEEEDYDPDFAPNVEPEPETKKRVPADDEFLDDDELEEMEDEEEEEEEPGPLVPGPLVPGRIPVSIPKVRPHAPGSAAPHSGHSTITSGPSAMASAPDMLAMSLHQHAFSTGMTRNRNEVAGILNSMKASLDIASQTSEICAKILKFINDESIIKIAVFYEVTSKGNILEIAFSAIKMSGTKVSIPREVEGEIMAVILSSHDTTNMMTGYTVEFGIGSSSELVMTVHNTKWSPGNQVKQNYTILNPDLLL